MADEKPRAADCELRPFVVLSGGNDEPAVFDDDAHLLALELRLWLAVKCRPPQQIFDTSGVVLLQGAVLQPEDWAVPADRSGRHEGRSESVCVCGQ